MYKDLVLSRIVAAFLFHRAHGQLPVNERSLNVVKFLAGNDFWSTQIIHPSGKKLQKTSIAFLDLSGNSFISSESIQHDGFGLDVPVQRLTFILGHPR